MKKILVTLMCAVLVSATAFAAPFAPTLLKVTADQYIHYDFTGSRLDIPVTVTGHTAGLIFLVYTKGKAEQIAPVQNGYLGWHYVNKVDTCLYFSPLKSVNQGANVISWDGKNQDGARVPADEYTYYIWAFDNQGAKVQMSKVLQSGWGFDYYTNIQSVGTDGLPLANPIWYTPVRRWAIGNDPFDDTLLVTTSLTLATGWSQSNDAVLDAADYNIQYISVRNAEAKQASVQKMKFVPGGSAEIFSDWGESNGYATIYSTMGGGTPGMATDGTYLFTGDENHVASTDPDSQFYIYDFEGNMVKEVDLTPWWSSPEAYAVGAQMNGGPNNFSFRDGYVFLNCHCNCLNQMVSPSRYLESGEYEDFFVWSNGNGDYTLDHNFEDTATLKWVCNDYNVGPYKYCVSPDANLFVAVNAYDVGAVSFGLMGPDGEGLGYYAFAGETAGWKKGVEFIQDGTPFDGLYCDNEQSGGAHYAWDGTKLEPGIFFLGHDSIKGTIGTGVGVEDAAPAAFTVAQNSPNPFNPTTTISFSLVNAGNVTVDVFNVAGQKVDTLANGFMAAGSHSVVWDASNFSAGVYFYTVKSGSMSKTMKMTLVK